MILYRLSHEASRLVTRELASSDGVRYAMDDVRPFVEPCERRIDLSAFDRVVRELLAATSRYDAAFDALAAPRLHRALPLSRREAADPGVWRFLAVVHCPELVRHRWEFRAWAPMRARFWRPGTRPDSNAIGRLWWIAELCRDGDDYALAERLLARQPVANAAFVRAFCGYRPALAAFADVVADAPADEVEAVARRFNALLSTVVVESQTRADLADWLRRLRAAVRAGDGG